MADESRIIDRWLAVRLATDATLTGLVGTRIYDGLAEQAAAFPYIRHQPLDVSDDNGTGPERCGVTATYVVFAVAAGESFGTATSGLELIVGRIDTLLMGYTSVFEGHEISAERRKPVRLYPEIDGKQLRELGAEWRIELQPA